MKKGSGTFFVCRRFCGESTQSSKQAKAGYHYDGGILPFVLYGAFGAIAAYVRTGSLYTSDKV